MDEKRQQLLKRVRRQYPELTDEQLNDIDTDFLTIMLTKRGINKLTEAKVNKMAKESKDSAKVEGPNPGTDVQKVPSGEIKDWEKANGEDGATAAKDPAKEVEKTMKDLGGEGAAPNQIKVNGYIYNRVDANPTPEFIKIEGQLYKRTEEV